VLVIKAHSIYQELEKVFQLCFAQVAARYIFQLCFAQVAARYMLQQRYQAQNLKKRASGKLKLCAWRLKVATHVQASHPAPNLYGSAAFGDAKVMLTSRVGQDHTYIRIYGVHRT
jgi:hypothetical protein